jgi:pheromone shutdown protein TraB
MSENNKLEILSDGIESYIQTNAELLKLEATARTVAIGSGIISGILLGSIAVIILFFASFAAAIYLSNVIHNNYSGFLIMTGIYSLLLTVLLIGRKRMVEIPLRNLIIRKVFENEYF